MHVIRHIESVVGEGGCLFSFGHLEDSQKELSVRAERPDVSTIDKEHRHPAFHILLVKKTVILTLTIFYTQNLSKEPENPSFDPHTALEKRLVFVM